MRPFQRFVATESAGGVVLLLSALIALAWANSPWSDAYVHLWKTPLGFRAGGREFVLSLHHWINDGLMAVFFFVVGLEIKREMLVGELSSARQAALPVAAALGGMIVPALIYAGLNAGSPGEAGWGIPMATDIAFALGVLALLGPRVPVGLNPGRIADRRLHGRDPAPKDGGRGKGAPGVGAERSIGRRADRIVSC